jgi:hypothetical protein
MLKTPAQLVVAGHWNLYPFTALAYAKPERFESAMPTHGKPFFLPALCRHGHIDTPGLITPGYRDANDPEAVVLRLQLTELVHRDTPQLRRGAERALASERANLSVPPGQGRLKGGVLIRIPVVSKAFSELSFTAFFVHVGQRAPPESAGLLSVDIPVWIPRFFIINFVHFLNFLITGTIMSVPFL